MSTLISFVPMASVSEISGAITSEEFREASEVIKGFTSFKDRDVLVAKITPCFENGKIAHARITKPLGFGSTEFHVVRPKTDILDDRYLYHFLRQPIVREEGERRMTGSAGQKRVPRAFLEELNIPVPPLPEQRRIAAMLDKADALRAKRREAIAKLDQLLQSVFLEMFGDPVTNPKGWPVAAIGDCCSRVTVGIVVKPASYYVVSGIPAIRSLNIGANRIVAENLVYFSEQDNFGALKKTILRAGDVVAVRSGQPGKAAVIPPELHGSNAIDVLIASTNQSVLLPEYLAFFLNSSAGKKLVLTEQRGQVQKHLNVKQLSEAQLPLPPLSEQRKFLDIAGAVAIQEKRLKAALVDLDSIFAGIQSEAFAGKH